MLTFGSPPSRGNTTDPAVLQRKREIVLQQQREANDRTAFLNREYGDGRRSVSSSRMRTA